LLDENVKQKKILEKYKKKSPTIALIPTLSQNFYKPSWSCKKMGKWKGKLAKRKKEKEEES